MFGQKFSNLGLSTFEISSNIAHLLSSLHNVNPSEHGPRNVNIASLYISLPFIQYALVINGSSFISRPK